jgi:hypothetical protein
MVFAKVPRNSSGRVLKGRVIRFGPETVSLLRLSMDAWLVTMPRISRCHQKSHGALAELGGDRIRHFVRHEVGIARQIGSLGGDVSGEVTDSF